MNRKEPTISTQKAAIPLTVFDSSNLFVAPRDPTTKTAAIGLSPAVRDAVTPQESPPTKKRVDFAGGFKVPEEVMQRLLDKKRPLEYEQDDLDEVGGDNQLTREDIMAQLNLNQNASKYSGAKLGATKEQTKTDLVFGIDKEMEKLRRQAQNISMRREMAKRIEEGGRPKDTNQPSPAEVEAAELQKDIRALDPVHNIIHAHPQRVQVIRHKISNLGLENLNPDQIEKLRKKHEMEMKEVEEQYFKKKQSEQLLRKYQSGSSSYHDPYRQSNLTSGDNSPRKYERQIPTRAPPVYSAPIRISSGALADLPVVTGHSPGKIDPSKPLKPEEREYVNKYMRYKRRKSREEQRRSESPPPREDFDLYTSGPDSPSRKGKELKKILKEQQKPGNMDYRPTRKLFGRHEVDRDDDELEVSVNGSTFERAQGPVHLSHLGDNDGTQPAVTFADPLVQRGKSPPRRVDRVSHDRGKKKQLRPAQKKAFHLLKWIFNSIDTHQTGVISKAKLVEEVRKGHDQILAVFSSTSAVQLENKFQRQRTADPLSFTWEEFVEMALDEYDTSGLLKSVSPQKRLRFEEEEEQQQNSFLPDKGTRLLSDALMSKMREVYQQTDKYQDHVVKRKDLLFNLRTNPDVVGEIDADAVLTEDLGVKLTLDEVLAEVEFDEREERKRKQDLADPVITREYITWNQFKDYFEKYRPRAERNCEDEQEELAEYRGTQYKVPMELLPSELRYGVERESQLDQVDPEEVIELNFKVMDDFKEVFDKIVEEQGGQLNGEEEEVDTLELLIGIRNLPNFKNFELNHARSATEKSLVAKREKVQDVLERIEEQWTHKSGITWREFEAHFTRWGIPRERPTSPEEDLVPVLQSAQTPNFVSHKAKIETIREASPQEEWTQELQKEKTQKRSRSQGDKKTVSIKEAAEKGDLSQVRLELKDYEKQRDRSVPSRGRPKSAQPPAITVPRPFSFMQRDSSKTRSIREMKLAEMIAEKQAEEEAIVNYQFRHKEPPPEVTNKRYRALMEAEKQRREEVRVNSQAILKSKEKPFSFYLRDKEREALKQKEDNLPDAMRHPLFKAKEIPKAVQSQLYKKMDDQEEKKRKQRISHNAQISFAKAKLPPRMEMHEKMKKQQQELGLVKNKSLPHSFKPKITKEVPDFDLKYKQFMQQLEKKRQQKRGTELRPFHFNECKKSLGLRKYMDEYNQDKGNTINNELAAGAGAKQLIGVAKNIKAISQQPAIMPATTKKTEEMRAKRRKEMEESRRQEEERMKTKQTIEEKMSKKSEIFQRVKQSDALVDNTKKLEEELKQKIQEKKAFFREKERQYQQDKKKMYEKVKKRPLLMETATQKKSGMLAEMKELKKVRDTMRKNGVDPEKFMTAEELDKAEDAAFLEKHGKA